MQALLNKLFLFDQNKIESILKEYLKGNSIKID